MPPCFGAFDGEKGTNMTGSLQEPEGNSEPATEAVGFSRGEGQCRLTCNQPQTYAPCLIQAPGPRARVYLQALARIARPWPLWGCFAPHQIGAVAVAVDDQTIRSKPQWKRP